MRLWKCLLFCLESRYRWYWKSVRLFLPLCFTLVPPRHTQAKGSVCVCDLWMCLSLFLYLCRIFMCVYEYVCLHMYMHLCAHPMSKFSVIMCVFAKHGFLHLQCLTCLPNSGLKHCAPHDTLNIISTLGAFVEIFQHSFNSMLDYLNDPPAERRNNTAALKQASKKSYSYQRWAKVIVFLSHK